LSLELDGVQIVSVGLTKATDLDVSLVVVGCLDVVVGGLLIVGLAHISTICIIIDDCVILLFTCSCGLPRDN